MIVGIMAGIKSARPSMEISMMLTSEQLSLLLTVCECVCMCTVGQVRSIRKIGLKYYISYMRLYV